MYEKKTDTTRQRDLRKLLNTSLLHQDAQGRLWLQFARPTPQAG